MPKFQALMNRLRSQISERFYLLGVVIAMTMLPVAAANSAMPNRVASLNMCTDELVLLLAAPEQIVSVTHLSQDRHEFPFWRSAQRYRANDGSIASVAGMRPDLIVTMGGLARDRAHLADRIGADTLILPFPQTLSDIEAAIRQVARALGREDRGNRFIAALHDLSASQGPMRSEILYLSDDGYSLAAGSLGAEWLALAGIEIADDQSGRVTAERMLIDPPEIVLRSDYRRSQTSRGQFWPGFRFLSRSPETEILYTDGRRWTCSGLSLLPEILRLREAVVR